MLLIILTGIKVNQLFHIIIKILIYKRFRRMGIQIQALSRLRFVEWNQSKH